MIYNPPLKPLLNVIYADDDILILNKPSGLLSVPGRKPEHKDSLQTRAQQKHPSATTVHRLDMETSGIMVMALNKSSHKFISLQFEKRLIKKSYLARVYGNPKTNSGTIDAPLICDWPNRPKQIIDYDNGKKAITHWKKIKTETHTCLLQLYPITGRSHQLRVHLKHIGLPIVGDRLYAPPAALNYSNQLQLHSQEITMKHPKSQQIISFDTPDILDTWRKSII